MDIGTFRGIMTGILMLAFIGLVLWAYSRSRRKDFEEAAHLPLEDNDELETLHRGQHKPRRGP